MANEASAANFTMKVSAILGPESDAGAVVIGPLFGTPPVRDDIIELVGLHDVREVQVVTCEETNTGFVMGLKGINKDAVTQRDILQSPGRVTRFQRDICLPTQALFSPDSLTFGRLDEAIVRKGEECVPVVIECFLNPVAPNPILNYMSGIANQSTLAHALVKFAEQGNQEASLFLHEVAVGKMPVLKNAEEVVQIIATQFVERWKKHKEDES